MIFGLGSIISLLYFSLIAVVGVELIGKYFALVEKIGLLQSFNFFGFVNLGLDLLLGATVRVNFIKLISRDLCLAFLLFCLLFFLFLLSFVLFVGLRLGFSLGAGSGLS